jgi:LysM repeat protein
MGKIIDISHHQPSNNFDWAAAAKELDLVIIRVQYGSTTIDREYKKHVANCKKYGIPFAHYAYGLFTDEADAKKEAADFLDRIDPAAKFLVLDTEGHTVSSAGSAVAAASQAFIDHCKAAGHKVGFYIAHHLYKQYGLDKVKADFLWIPRYGANNGEPSTRPDFPCDIWQYTEKGRVSWFNSYLDLNKLNGDKDLSWFIGEKKSEPVTPAPTESKPVTKKITDPYTVQPGDTLSEIAAAAGKSLDELIKINGIKDKNVISVGQVIRLTAPKAPPAPAAPSGKTYTVKPGDALSRIAAAHGVSTAALAAHNKIKDADVIFAGQVIKIPAGGSAAPKAAAAQYHKVGSGDSLSRIAAKHGVSLDQVKRLNPGVKGPKYIIHPGQKIRVK